MSTIVFLPGWGFNASIWESFIGRYNLEDVLLIDLPAFSNSINEVIAELAGNIPDDSIIIGWSLGGLLATYIAFQYPFKCKKLILPASLPKFIGDKMWAGISAPFFQAFLTLANSNMNKLLNRFHLLVQMPNKINKETNKYFSSLDATSLINYLHFMEDTDARGMVSDLNIPIYYFFHTDDAIFDAIPENQLSNLGEHIAQINLGGNHASILAETLVLSIELRNVLFHA